MSVFGKRAIESEGKGVYECVGFALIIFKLQSSTTIDFCS